MFKQVKLQNETPSQHLDVRYYCLALALPMTTILDLKPSNLASSQVAE
jgi:hypothetical protein